MTFELLKVKPEIVKALKEQGIDSPTLIQKKAIPLIKSGKDLIGMSKTGSGKTAAFGVPVLEMVSEAKGVQVLILSPTRELACQISKELQNFGKYMFCSVATVFGGVAIGPQMKQIRKSEIVVGTPGRLLDHLGRRTLDLSRLRCIVLDEADKMVDMGFIDDIKRILSYAPEKKQVLLFGATLSEEIGQIKKQHMNDPAVAQAEKHVKEDMLKQYYYNIDQREKFSLLVHLLKKEEIGRAIIFCSARATVEIVTRNLKENDINAEMIHGKLSQNQRLHVIERFSRGNTKILVASAVAARGIHVDDVTHIFNYDLSHDPQEYIHRVGRTARAGEAGKAITLLSQRDHDAFSSILRFHDVKIEALPNETFPRVSFRARSPERRFRRGPGNRGRSNYRGGPSHRSGPPNRSGPHRGPSRGGPRHRSGPSSGPRRGNFNRKPSGQRSR
ncbi:MAG: DEAD/DEAH box helicase [bacterium]|nr:DEAD/DEAH box helicase [bacterium]